MSKSEIEDRITEFARKAASEHGLELVHAELAGSGKGRSVRVFVEKASGVTHEDCTVISREIESALDSSDLMMGRYVLEVSSPGIERGLYSADDFERFAGSRARLKTRVAIEGQRNFRGRIVEVNGDEIVFDDRSRGIVKVSWGEILKANLEFDLENELKGAKKHRR